MAYLTYTEYQAYGGTLTQTRFDDLEFEAEAYVNRLSFNRFMNDTTFPDALKRLVKKLIDVAEKKEDALSLGSKGGDAYVTNQSNDGVSVTFNGMSASDLFRLTKTESDRLIVRYLSGVKNEAGRLVLYRGLYPGE